MARTKSKTSVVSDKPPCPECGGRKFGRGYNHSATCTLNFKNQPKNSAGKVGKRRGAGRRQRVMRGGVDGNVINPSVIARMPIDAVIQLRRDLDDVLRNRQGEVRRMVKELKSLLA